MLSTVFATKIGMTQAWTTAGKRVPVTRCKFVPNIVVGTQPSPTEETILEVGYGAKKLKNMPKPQRAQLEKMNVSQGVQRVQGVRVAPSENELPQVGSSIAVETILTVGDVVQVQGTSKGKGFAGAMKRHGFSGAQITHGQSDRQRAVGSIGAGTIPGRVFKGKRMPGHMGDVTKTVSGLVVIHVDPTTQEVWLSGPVPGAASGFVRIVKTGKTKQLDIIKPAGYVEPVAEEAQVEVTADQTENTEIVTEQAEVVA
jgi:large subunit ribosomal protein L3